MSNRGFRLIASAIVASGGAVTLALTRHDAGDIAGLALTVIGGGLCLTDWIASWREDQRKLPIPNDSPDVRLRE
jgi:hypothetical protein